MTPQRFKVLLERPDGLSRGAGFRVPQRVMDAFAPARRVPVVVTINEFNWRTTIAPYGGEFVVPVRDEVCTSIGAQAGDTVEVAIERDGAPRTVEIPADLVRALNEAGVREAFNRLSFTHQKELTRSIAEAKRPETRERRIEAAVAKVASKPAARTARKRSRRK